MPNSLSGIMGALRSSSQQKYTIGVSQDFGQKKVSMAQKNSDWDRSASCTVGSFQGRRATQEANIMANQYFHAANSATSHGLKKATVIDWLSSRATVLGKLY